MILCHFREVPHAVTEYRLRRLRPYKILIHEDEDEQNQIRSYVYALRFFLFSAFRITTSAFQFYAQVSNLGVDLTRPSPVGATLTVKPNRPEISQFRLQP